MPSANGKKLIYKGDGSGIVGIPAMDLELTAETIKEYATVLACKQAEVEQLLIDTGLYATAKAGK